ncbi:MAG: DNA polymerase IV [Candidatus Bathyarchaeota archaeon]|nr:MAG: DNA polymerase IV [Candidatus Bathyarchaeota archaeon]
MTNLCNGEHIILHVDMDHFFSAIEEREHPEFKGKPVVVGADPMMGAGRGVVKTCNYEARKYKIHSGMPISRAWQLCSKAIYVRANYQLYKKVSKAIMTILRRYSIQFQPWGFDEAFLDVSNAAQNYEEAAKLAVAIKHDILWNETLTCSIGIAPNKLVAKIASDFKKPDGLTVVKRNHVKQFLAPLPVQKMLWIGKKTKLKLNKIGIETIGDLANHDISTLVEMFGVMGRRFHQWSLGVHMSEVKNRTGTRKSIGHQSTFSVNTNDMNIIIKRLDEICLRIHSRCIKYRTAFRTVTVIIRFGDFQTFSHGKTLPLFTQSLQTLQKTSLELTQGLLKEKRTTRLVGVRVSNLKSSEGQETL